VDCDNNKQSIFKRFIFESYQIYIYDMNGIVTDIYRLWTLYWQ